MKTLIDDEDEVRFVSVPRATEESLKSKEKKKGTLKVKSKPGSACRHGKSVDAICGSFNYMSLN